MKMTWKQVNPHLTFHALAKKKLGTNFQVSSLKNIPCIKNIVLYHSTAEFLNQIVQKGFRQQHRH